MTRKRLVVVTLLTFCYFGYPAPSKAVRARKPFMVLLGLCDPFPSNMGITAAWNIVSRVRWSVGYGYGSKGRNSLTMFGTNFKLFILEWNLSPWAELGAGYGKLTGSEGILGFNSSADHLFGGFGLEWMGEEGFTASVGYHISARDTALSYPTLQIGWAWSF